MQHLTKDSMHFESLREMIEVAEYCVNFDKTGSWGVPGCYGYPATILLFCIVDGVGAYIHGGGYDTKKHFKILNDLEWYNLGIEEGQIEILRNAYRNKLNHENVIEEGLALDVGNENDPVIITVQGMTILYLRPFLRISKYVVEKMLREKLKMKILV